MSQRWAQKEIEFRIDGVPPGESAEKVVAVMPVSRGGKPFRMTAIEAEDRQSFRLVQCYAVDRKAFKKDGEYDLPAHITGAVSPGAAFTVTVKNVSSEAKTFVGKFVGEELLDR